MRALLTLPVRSVGGCFITAAALANIIGVAAGYGALIAHASFVIGCLLFVF